MSDKALDLGMGEDDPVNLMPAPREVRLDWLETAAERNQQRALFAGAAVTEFAERVGLEYDPVDTAMSDLLCNLMHLADATGNSFGGLVERGRMHYEAEIGGEG